MTKIPAYFGYRELWPEAARNARPLGKVLNERWKLVLQICTIFSKLCSCCFKYWRVNDFSRNFVRSPYLTGKRKKTKPLNRNQNWTIQRIERTEPHIKILVPHFIGFICSINKLMSTSVRWMYCSMYRLTAVAMSTKLSPLLYTLGLSFPSFVRRFHLLLQFFSAGEPMCSWFECVTVDLIRRSWVRFPPRSKDFFFTSCGSLIPFTRANAQWVILGFN